MNAFASITVDCGPDGQGASDIVGYIRARLLRPGEKRENIHAIFLDAQRRFLGEAHLPGESIGTFRIRLRDILAKALDCGAEGMIMAHNHPSGYCHPSRQDIEATRKLSKIARALDIELVDHLIITHDSAYSMRLGGKL